MNMIHPTTLQYYSVARRAEAERRTTRRHEPVPRAKVRTVRRVNPFRRRTAIA
jgi:hypothetical protein